MTSPHDLALPFASWSPGQWETITRLVCSDKRFILLEAPTGSGKSAVITGYANLMEFAQTIVLTGQKQLQDQYKKSLDYFSVMGRNNFPCLISPVTADQGDCTIGVACRHKTLTTHIFRPPEPHEGCIPCDDFENDGYPDKDVCPYYYQRYHGEQAGQVVLNYAYWLSMANYTASYKSRELMVFDEAHTLEDELRRFTTIGFSYHTVTVAGASPCFAEPDDVVSWQLWAQKTRIELAREYFKIQKNTAGPVTDKHDEAERKAIVSLMRAFDMFLMLSPEYWVGDKNDAGTRIEFKPVRVGPLADRLVYQHLGEKVILMSGTILDREIFCDSIGLDPDECEFIQVDSTFPVENRPMFYAPYAKGSYRDPEYVKGLIEHIDLLIDKHPEQSGIIHTVSYALTQAIIKNSRHTTRMITHDKDTKQAALALFRRNPGSVWVSPSSTTGLDLPYDECRWQIIAKLPFPNQGDKQIKQLMKEDPSTGRPSPSASKWYSWATLCSFLQAYGRGMRAVDDSCTTYLIDPAWKWFRPSTRRMQPEWFRQAVRTLAPVLVNNGHTPPSSTSNGTGDVFSLLTSLGIRPKSS